MADTKEFFDSYLPQKIQGNPELAKSINAVFQFDIDGAGTWTLDLTGDGTVSAGPHDEPGCVITTDRDTWEKVLDNPNLAIQMFMMGKLKASNIGLATQLQKILT